MTAAPARAYPRSLLPPWLWFWLAFYTVNFPGRLSSWKSLWNTIIGREVSPTPLATRVDFLLRIPALFELMLSLALFAGFIAVIAPHIRTRLVERRFALTEASVGVPALDEIRVFVENHAPGMRLKSNLLRGDAVAFAYPLGYHTSAIAVFGPLIRLWRADRQAAEAVLLHEIAHAYQGDALIVGTGSLFEQVVRYWPIVYLLLVPLPFLIVNVAGTFWPLHASAELQKLGIPETTSHTLSASGVASIFFHLTLPQLGLQLGTNILWTLGLIVLPLAGIWCAELNADRFAVVVVGRPDGMAHALRSLPAARSWWRWLLFRASHPPVTLRRWFVVHEGHAAVVFALLCLFPLAYAVRWLILTGWAFGSYSLLYLGGDGFPLREIMGELGTNTRLYLGSLRATWAWGAAVFLVWPLAADFWARIFGGGQMPRQSRYSAYVIAAAVAVMLFAVGQYARPGSSDVAVVEASGSAAVAGSAATTPMTATSGAGSTLAPSSDTLLDARGAGNGESAAFVGPADLSICWELTGRSPTGTFGPIAGISLVRAGGLTIEASLGEQTGSGCATVRIDPGRYYLKILATDWTNWRVVVRPN
jgi:Zn-dependent protease with chaperone function